METWTPKPGQPLELGREANTTRWWPDLPWRDGGSDPIVSSQLGEATVGD